MWAVCGDFYFYYFIYVLFFPPPEEGDGGGMTCYHPLRAFRSRVPNNSGKYGIHFGGSYSADPSSSVQIPCGQCIGCRLEYARQWAMRCYHEASLYDNNCFITLTYDDDHLPVDMSLNKVHFQLFFKRLRKKYGEGIRFFHCGEYGERFGRPHYHACIFNHDFSDKILWRDTGSGNRLYVSDSLTSLWGNGFCSLGSVTFESASYVARYVTKKITGDRAKEHYTFINTETGEWFERSPEYTTMSRRPGIGKRWFDKFKGDVYPDDFVVMRGMKMKPPRYYDSQYEVLSEADMLSIKLERQRRAFASPDNTPERLRVREVVKTSRVSLLTRSVDEDT